MTELTASLAENYELIAAESAIRLRECAEKGYAWLLERGPSLGLDVRLINTETLNLMSDCQCVLGQLGGNYGGVIVQLREVGELGDESREWAREHGFWVWDGSSDVSATEHIARWRYLTQCWKNLINADRQAAAA